MEEVVPEDGQMDIAEGYARPSALSRANEQWLEQLAFSPSPVPLGSYAEAIRRVTQVRPPVLSAPKQVHCHLYLEWYPNFAPRNLNARSGRLGFPGIFPASIHPAATKIIFLTYAAGRSAFISTNQYSSK